MDRFCHGFNRAQRYRRHRVQQKGLPAIHHALTILAGNIEMDEVQFARTLSPA